MNHGQITRPLKAILGFLRSHPGQGKGRKDVKVAKKGSFRGPLFLDVRVSLPKEYIM